MSRRSPRLRRRPARTVPAVLTALVLLTVGVLGLLAVGWRLAQDRWPSPAQAFGGLLGRTSWGSPGWTAVCAGTLLLGLVLLVAALKPGRVNVARLRLPVDPGPTATEAVISRRAVARLAGARADTVDGVDRVSVSATARRVQVRLSTTSEQTAEIERAVRAAVGHALTEAGLEPVPAVRVSARTREI